MRHLADKTLHICCMPALLTYALLCLLAIAVFSVLPACGGPSGESSTAAAAPSSSSGATGAAYTQPSEVLIPPTSDRGIDTSGVEQGWVCASATSASRLKFQVSSGDMTYNYDLPNDGTPALFPINMGDGSYLFRVMQNTEGKNYVEVERAEADVTLTSEVAPFLIPNQICSYVASSDCVAKARELTSDSSNEGEAVEAICTYVVKNVAYDKAKAAELATATGYIPDPDETLSTGKGICFDYAALSAAMLRSMGLPAKVITGYVGQEQLYHAWIMVYIDGTWKTASFSVTPNTWSRCDVTFASTGATQYTGSGSSYTDRYTY